jgi:WD40 repeat protein
LELLSAANDGTVKISALDSMKVKTTLKFPEPVNYASLSPDGNLVGSYGDCIQANISDLRSGKIV